MKNGIRPRALEARLLNDLPNLLPALKITAARRHHPSRSHASADLLVDVVTPARRRRRLVVEVKAAGAPSQIVGTVQAMQARLQGSRAAYPVLASTFLSPRARQVCREAGIGYVDLAGNCYLHFDDFHVEKIVERNPFPQRGRPASLFTPVSSRIVRALLEEPQRAWQVSELARATQVSLGQTSNVCRRVIGEGYGALVERRLRLTEPAKLLEAWREGYAASANVLEPYYSFEQTPERLLAKVAEVAAARGWRYAVTAFAAASMVAPFVRGVGTVEWYVEDAAALAEWVGALELRPAESGPNAIVRIPYDAGVFYRAQTVGGVILVSNLQLYLDLSMDPGRGREQAEFLRAQRITWS